MGITFKRNIPILVVMIGSLLFSTAACSKSHADLEKDKQQTTPKVTKKQAPLESAPSLEKATPEKIKNAVFQVLGFNAEKGEQKISSITVDPNDHITIRFVPNANAAGDLLPFTIQQDITNILWGIKKSQLKVGDVQLIVTGQTAPDQSGNTAQKEIVNVTYHNETIQNTNYESINTDIILSLADTTTYIDPSMINH